LSGKRSAITVDFGEKRPKEMMVKPEEEVDSASVDADTARPSTRTSGA